MIEIGLVLEIGSIIRRKKCHLKTKEQKDKAGTNPDPVWAEVQGEAVR